MLPFWAHLLAIPIFGFLILVHEAGHYLAAVRRGIAVAEFAVGFGPRLAGFAWRGTEWTLRLIPLGGYVRWEEEGEGAFGDAALGARTEALFAGPLFNLLLTVLLQGALYGSFYGKGWESLSLAVKGTGLWTTAWLEGLAGLFGGGVLPAIVSPAGLAEQTAQAAAAGPEQLLIWAAFLSLNFGLLNLLPLPGLDGGRLCLLLLERIRRRPLDPLMEGWIHAGGFVVLMAVALITFVRDLLA